MNKAYFAYGANLDPVSMKTRCPDATPRGRAVLRGHRFFITLDGYASVRAEAGRQVNGLLWYLPALDETALDQFEGVPDGLYQKDHRLVIHESGNQVAAMIYVARAVHAGRARPGYLEGILAAASSLGFPPDYLDELRRSELPS